MAEDDDIVTSMRQHGSAVHRIATNIEIEAQQYESWCHVYDELVAFKMGVISKISLTIHGKKVNGRNVQQSSWTIPQNEWDTMFQMRLDDLKKNMDECMANIQKMKEEL